jgi:hypothetical protein
MFALFVAWYNFCRLAYGTAGIHREEITEARNRGTVGGRPEGTSKAEAGEEEAATEKSDKESER